MAVRRVRRVLRRVDPWTVLKVSVVLNAVLGMIFVLGVWVVWSLLLQRGVPDRIVDIFEAIRITITLDGELYFRIVVFLAIVGAIALTGLVTLGAVLYNLIADLVGGIELTVLEETYNVPQQVVAAERVRPTVHYSTGESDVEARAEGRAKAEQSCPPESVEEEAALTAITSEPTAAACEDASADGQSQADQDLPTDKDRQGSH